MEINTRAATGMFLLLPEVKVKHENLNLYP